MGIWKSFVVFACGHYHLFNYIHAKVIKLPIFPIQKVKHCTVATSIIDYCKRLHWWNNFYQLFKALFLSFRPVVINSSWGRSELFKLFRKVFVQFLLGFSETHDYFLLLARYTSMILFPS